MIIRLLSLSCLLFCLTHCTAAPLTTAELLKTPDRYLGKTVDVQIAERLWPSTPEAQTSPSSGSIQVLNADLDAKVLRLVTSIYRQDNPDRFRDKFDRVMIPPLRVKGEFLLDREMTESSHLPYYVIRVLSWEGAPVQAPVALTLSQIKVDPAKWDRKRVIYEGVHSEGFELSVLDQEIWLDVTNETLIEGKPVPQEGCCQVRVTGTLFSNPSRRYGHINHYPFAIEAAKLEYLK